MSSHLHNIRQVKLLSPEIFDNKKDYTWTVDTFLTQFPFNKRVEYLIHISHNAIQLWFLLATLYILCTYFVK